MTLTPGPPEVPRPERQHRVFFASWPTDDLRAALAPRIRALQTAGVGRPQRPDQWHVTLQFLGPVPASRLAAVRDAAEQVREGPCEIEFNAVEFWRRPEVITLMARVLPPPLDRLVNQLRVALAARGFEPDSRPFRAHLTLARKVTHPGFPKKRIDCRFSRVMQLYQRPWRNLAGQLMNHRPFHVAPVAQFRMFTFHLAPSAHKGKPYYTGT